MNTRNDPETFPELRFRVLQQRTREWVVALRNDGLLPERVCLFRTLFDSFVKPRPTYVLAFFVPQLHPNQGSVDELHPPPHDVPFSEIVKKIHKANPNQVAIDKFHFRMSERFCNYLERVSWEEGLAEMYQTKPEKGGWWNEQWRCEVMDTDENLEPCVDTGDYWVLWEKEPTTATEQPAGGKTAFREETNRAILKYGHAAAKLHKRVRRGIRDHDLDIYDPTTYKKEALEHIEELPDNFSPITVELLKSLPLEVFEVTASQPTRNIIGGIIQAALKNSRSHPMAIDAAYKRFNKLRKENSRDAS